MSISMRRLFITLAVGSAAAAPLGCSSDSGGGGDAGSGTHAGGATSTAGTGTAQAGSGGASSTSGANTGGSSANTGGSSTIGGMVATGGATGGGSSAGTGTGGTSSGGGNTGGTAGAGTSGANTGGTGTGTIGGGGSPATGSPGCNMPAGQALGSWVEQPKLNVAGTDRQWWVWLPTGYDQAKPYPVVFTFHGCSSSDNIVPMQKVAGDKAILVRGTGISQGTCWDAGATGPDVKFFDQMLADITAKRCIDTSRVFATGYSSGSWLANTLDCERGDKLRGVGTVSGGTYGDKSKCKGKFARVFIHDQDDTTNAISAGDDKELPRLVTANHCTPNMQPVMEAPAPCARYQGCDAGFPVVWCQTQGKQHDRQDSLAPGAFWGVFSTL